VRCRRVTCRSSIESLTFITDCVVVVKISRLLRRCVTDCALFFSAAVAFLHRCATTTNNSPTSARQQTLACHVIVDSFVETLFCAFDAPINDVGSMLAWRVATGFCCARARHADADFARTSTRLLLTTTRHATICR
jgi:hypothetical protein